MLYLNPLNWARWCSEFVHAWLMAVPWRDAPKAIPALILSVVMLIITMVAFSDRSGWRNMLLDKQLQAAYEADDFKTAEVVVRRQLESDPKKPELLFKLAAIRHQRGFEEEASDRMRMLVLDRHPGAAKWLFDRQYMKNFVGKPWSSLSKQQLNEFGLILDVIYHAESDDLQCKQMFAEYLTFRGKLESALEILRELAPTDPIRGLRAASLARRLGDQADADRLAREALMTIQKLSLDDPTNSALSIAIANNQLFLERFDEAARTLVRALKLAKTKKEKAVLSQVMGDAIVVWISHIEKARGETVEDRLRILKMLRAALNYAPNNPRVIRMVADQVLATLEEKDENLVAVRESLLRGTSPGISHFIKGTSALINEDITSAMMHLEMASDQMPQSGAVLNNLAVAMALQKEPDLDKALKVANAAIEHTPEPTPHFFETRGQIFYRMGNFRAAIPDLERALAEPQLARKAHEMLATCYERLGERDLAVGHRKRAENLK